MKRLKTIGAICGRILMILAGYTVAVSTGAIIAIAIVKAFMKIMPSMFAEFITLLVSMGKAYPGLTIGIGIVLYIAGLLWYICKFTKYMMRQDEQQ